MSKELRECPFCQSRAEHYSFNYRIHTVRCCHCLADCGEHDNPERAAFVWNTRPNEEALKAENERLRAENRMFRTLCRRRNNLLQECSKLSRLLFPKKDYSKESLFKIINQIYMLVSGVDDAPDTKKGEKDNE